MIFNLTKKLISLFPSTLPFRLYNILIKIPFLKNLINLTIQKLTPDQLDIQEGKIIFDKEDPVMSGAISLGQYEPETMTLFRSFLKEGDVFIDIGANLGYFTVIAANRVGHQGKVFSYEPDPHNFKLLEKNIAINEFKNVTAVPIALSDSAGKRDLFFGDNHCTHSFNDKKNNGESELVITDTLDNSLKNLGCLKVNLIKIDIEGAEPIAFEGMKETIENNRSLVIFFEFYPNAIKRLDYSPIEFLEKLKNLGFSLSVIDEDLKTCSVIKDLKTFTKTFHEKDLSRNLIAIRK